MKNFLRCFASFYFFVMIVLMSTLYKDLDNMSAYFFELLKILATTIALFGIASVLERLDQLQGGKAAPSSIRDDTDEDSEEDSEEDSVERSWSCFYCGGTNDKDATVCNVCGKQRKKN